MPQSPPPLGAATTTASSSSAPLPVVDLAHPSLPALRDACETYGFFYLRNHGIPSSLLHAALRQCKAFFALPLTTKNTLRGATHSQGYQPLGTETLNKKEQTRPCTQEGFRLTLTPPSPTQPWPDPMLLPHFRPVIEKYHAAMEEVAHRVTRLLLASVGLPPTYLHEEQKAFSPHAAAVTRLLHYAPIMSNAEEGVFGCGRHTDWGVLTLLLTEEEGLEVLCPRRGGREEGEWLRVSGVPPCVERLKIKGDGDAEKELEREGRKGEEEEEEEGEDEGKDGEEDDVPKEPTKDTASKEGEGEERLLICNLGDLLQRWTNDSLRSTPHRVVNREGRDRYSIPFFFTANPDAVVACLPPFLKGGREDEVRKGKYPPIVVSDYIDEKYRSITVGTGEEGMEGGRAGKGM